MKWIKFYRDIYYDREQAYLLGREYRDKGQHNKSQYSLTIGGVHINVLWGRQKVGHTSCNKETVQIEGRCQKTEWEDGIIVPLSGGKFVIYHKEVHTWYRDGCRFLEKKDIKEWHWRMVEIDRDIEVCSLHSQRKICSGATSLDGILTWLDESYAVHHATKSHDVGAMSMG